MSEAGTRPGPLAGLLVADFSRVLAGPYCTMLLADLGADVIKVESPAGDDTRRWGAAAAELARRADIMVENFKPGGLARYGLDYGAVSAANPGVIYASVTGFGTTGGAGLPGYDLMAQAISGLMSLTGEADGPPSRSGISLVDVITGLHTAIAILAALHHRAAAGEGQHVQSTLLVSALSGMVNQSSAYVAGGVVPFRMGNSHPSLTPYEPLPTADGELIVATGNDRQFRRLCEVIGAPQLASDPRFATTGDRTAHRAELRTLLVERLAARPSAAWFDLLIAAGVPTIRHPVDFSATPPSYPLPPPGLDEHGDQIRAWLAGPPAPVPWRNSAPQRGTSP